MVALDAATDSTIIDPEPFVRRDGRGNARLELAVKGAHCANCIAKIESGLKKLNGVTEARLNLSTGKLSVGWRDETQTPAGIVARVNAIGFEAQPYDPDAVLAGETEEGKSLLRALVIAGLGSVFVVGLTDMVWYSSGADLGPATRQMILWIAALVGIPAALLSSRVFFRSALAAASRGHVNMDTAIGLAIVLTVALSLYQTFRNGAHTYFDAAVMLPFLLLIGRYLDYLVRYRARSAARDLLAMQTVTASRLTAPGNVETVAAKDIAIGDRLLLRPGDRVPVNGILEGETEADLSMITGESVPARLTIGATAYAGAVVTGASCVMRSTARVENSLVAEISRLLELGQQNRSSYVRLADRAARIYVPSVFTAAIAVFVLWQYFLDAPFATAAENAIALLIVTCPCALGLAVPAVQVVASSTLFRRGVLVKSGDALERLAEIDHAVLDKTGTLTLGRPRLINGDEIGAETMEAAARLARASRHPLSRALAEAAGAGSIAFGAHEIEGCGVEAIIGGAVHRLGRADWVGARRATPSDGSELWFRSGDADLVVFRFEDSLRPDARDALAALNKRGLAVEILSGDAEGPVAHATREVGGASWHARIGAAEKAEHVRKLRDAGHRALVVGDGLNDAGALALAHVAMAPGTAIDATQTAADMVLQGGRLTAIDEAVGVAKAARRRVIENFIFAAAYNGIAIPIAAFGLVTPVIASVAMAASSLVVTLNALRLKSWRG